MDTYTTNIEDPTELTLDKLQEAYKHLEALLPELAYRTSECAPLTDKDGEAVFFAIPRAGDFLGGWGFFPVSQDFVLLHPDNLPRLQEYAKGKYRLVPLQDKATE